MSTKIEWATKVWNVTSGCDKVSPGCENCYAINMSNRLSGIEATKERYAGSVTKTKGGKLNWSGQIKLHEDQLDKPSTWMPKNRVFVNSMSDLFHEDVPFDFILRVWHKMIWYNGPTYMILTKRPERALEFFNWMSNVSRKKIDELGINVFEFCFHKFATTEPPRNIWIGTSAENQEQANKRIPYLLQIPAAVRFLSCEPLLGPIDLTKIQHDDFLQTNAIGNDHNGVFRKIKWVIAGGESGHNARPMHPDWLRSLRNQCQAAKVPFFFKQWGEWAFIEEGNEKLKSHKAQRKNLAITTSTGKLVTIVKDDNNNAYLFEPGTKNRILHKPKGKVIGVMNRVGKKAAGRLLDGREWNAFPLVEGG